ncbi:glycosyl hydrolase, partial [Bacteroidota bacterium]
MKNLFFTIIILILFIGCDRLSSKVEWPELTQQSKPWTRWWWMGNAVNKEDLKYALKEYQKAGLGGVEITPIYGVKGYEDKFLDYLSPEWVDMLIYTLNEASKQDLGVDMATGTGWPFGGPWVTEDDACKYVAYKTYTLKKGEILDEKVNYLQNPLVRAVGRKVNITELVEPIASNKNLQELALDQVRFEKYLPLVALMAYSDNGNVLDLTEKVDSLGKLNWIAIDGNWKLYAVFQGWHGKMVERAAPGGETNVIDHFSKKSLNNYLNKFEAAFENINIQSLRAFFNDSYEVDDAYGQANWTSSFFNEFQIRRGYDLRYHLAALFAQDSIEKNIRVLCDYRETISELLLEEFTIPWNKWAKSKKAITRNQSHGSPANILDLYAASDIPETEGNDILRFKFASSSANVTGKQLTSSESATWLHEHFQTSLCNVKNAIDQYFLGGINHIIYHGTTFSPADEMWPGWIFYASVHFGPTNTFWNDFAALNKYVSRCQSFLQEGKPDNEILLYFPFYDRISAPGKELLEHFSGKINQLENSEFAYTAKLLIEKGYSLDYIS